MIKTDFSIGLTEICQVVLKCVNGKASRSNSSLYTTMRFGTEQKLRHIVAVAMMLTRGEHRMLIR